MRIFLHWSFDLLFKLSISLSVKEPLVWAIDMPLMSLTLCNFPFLVGFLIVWGCVDGVC